MASNGPFGFLLLSSLVVFERSAKRFILAWIGSKLPLSPVRLQHVHIICSTFTKSTANIFGSLHCLPSMVITDNFAVLNDPFIHYSSVHPYILRIYPSSIHPLLLSSAPPQLPQTHLPKPSLHSFIQISIPPSQYRSTHRHSSILYEYIYPTILPSLPPSLLPPSSLGSLSPMKGSYSKT